MPKNKLLTFMYGFIVGATFMTSGFLMFEENETNETEQVQHSSKTDVSKKDTVVIGAFYSIDAIKLHSRIVAPDTNDLLNIEMDMMEEVKNHTAEWLYLFGKDSLDLGFPIVQFKFDEDFHDYIEEQERVKAEFERAKNEYELNRLKAETSKELVDKLVDSVRNVKKPTK